MRIPTEPLHYYRNRKETKALADDDKPEPVDSSAGLGATLSNTLAEREIPVQKRSAEAEKRAPRSGEAEQPSPNVKDERRREDRRKEKHPVLLDTRLKRCRRESSRKTAINLAI